MADEGAGKIKGQLSDWIVLLVMLGYMRSNVLVFCFFHTYCLNLQFMKVLKF